jgi:hypothetical protein
MRPVRWKEFVERGPYWNGRWPYTRAALRMARAARARSVLEIGPNGLPLHDMADTMDVAGEPTYRHDAGVVPWPIADRHYDLVMALQVWEHLEGRQVEAFGEVRRVARFAVLSFPLGWDRPEDPTHHGITRETVMRWTHGLVPLDEVLIGARTRSPRLVLSWRF